MKLCLRKPAKLLLGAAVFGVMFAGGLNLNGGSVSAISIGTPAFARIGRPLTPLSYAGVARRTTYRAVGGAYGPYGPYGPYGYRAPVAVRPVVVVPAPVVVVPPTCVDTVDAYGVVTRVCH